MSDFLFDVSDPDKLFREMDDFRNRAYKSTRSALSVKLFELLERAEFSRYGLVETISTKKRSTIYRMFDGETWVHEQETILAVCLCLCQTLEEAQEIFLLSGRALVSVHDADCYAAILAVLCPLDCPAETKIDLADEYLVSRGRKSLCERLIE